jgi:dihydrofolate synthase/folylpolyglutamate synthase
VHHYSSPHLVRFHERIRLAGRLIDEDALLALLEEVEAANGDKPITFFEVTTIAAFLAFSRTEADILLLETGLGGRLDATNLVAEPALTAITPISVDHTQFLGNSLAEIAAEKAGIMKPGVPCVLGPQPDQALEVLEAKAAEVGAPLWIHNRHWWTETEEGGFRLFVNDGVEWLPRPGLTGQHQIDNAGLAVVCALQLGASLAPDRDARALGVASAVWPARLQQLTEGRLVEALPEGWELWLDGGHNAGAGEALAQVAKDWKDGPLHLVYGMLNNKAAEGFLRPLAKQAQGLRAVEIPGEPNSLSAEEAAQKARDSGFSAQAAPSVKAALAQIAAENPWPGRILICGSLYLAGNVLAENETFPT